MSSTGAGSADKPATATESGAAKGTKPAKAAKSKGAATSKGTDGPEDVRAKFREALERKHHQHAAGNADGEGKDQSKVHEAHGPAGSKRSFRRKSG